MVLEHVEILQYRIDTQGNLHGEKMYQATINPFPNKPLFLGVRSTRLSKTLWEKEKLLTMSNFFFSHSVLYPVENFMPFSSNLKMSSANSFSFEESKYVVWERVNPLSDHKFQTLSKLKLLADHNFNVAQTVQWKENMFSKGLFLGIITSRDYVVKV